MGNSFSQHIREAFEELKNTYEPVAKSNYLDKALGDLLEKSLKEFETKMNANLQGIEKVCTKGSQWFAYYLGRRKESDLAGENHETSATQDPLDIDRPLPPQPQRTRSRNLRPKAIDKPAIFGNDLRVVFSEQLS